MPKVTLLPLAKLRHNYTLCRVTFTIAMFAKV